jgi:hypothetical protein
VPALKCQAEFTMHLAKADTFSPFFFSVQKKKKCLSQLLATQEFAVLVYRLSSRLLFSLLFFSHKKNSCKNSLIIFFLPSGPATVLTCVSVLWAFLWNKSLSLSYANSRVFLLLEDNCLAPLKLPS